MGEDYIIKGEIDANRQILVSDTPLVSSGLMANLEDDDDDVSFKDDFISDEDDEDEDVEMSRVKKEGEKHYL